MSVANTLGVCQTKANWQNKIPSCYSSPKHSRVFAFSSINSKYNAEHILRKSLHDVSFLELVGKRILLHLDLQDINLKTETKHIHENISTLQYLRDCQAKTIIVAHWEQNVSTIKQIANTLEELLGAEVYHGELKEQQELLENLADGNFIILPSFRNLKAELNNSQELAFHLSQGIDIMINDAFNTSHKVLASTVGVAALVESRLSGFSLHKELKQVQQAVSSNGSPQVAVIGGGNMKAREPLLKGLLSYCASVVVIGTLADAIINKKSENFGIKDCGKNNCKVVYCLGSKSSLKFTFDLYQWTQINHFQEIGKDIVGSKTVFWLVTSSVAFSEENSALLNKLSAFLREAYSKNKELQILASNSNQKEILKFLNVPETLISVPSGSTAFLEILEGKVLPGVAALDKIPPPPPDWDAVFNDPSLPLTVDIGCGNGIFVLRMACRYRSSRNFLGLEIFSKLVERCLVSAKDLRLPNTYFICTNAVDALDSLLKSYPGEVDLISIQCPDPDFMKPFSRRRMFQPKLIGAIINNLKDKGLIFLQSDIKDVALRMKEQMLTKGSPNVVLSKNYHCESKIDGDGWLLESPFDARTDWEFHAVMRGGQMFRVMLEKQN